MILSSLDSLHDTLRAEERLEPPGFATKPVRYLVHLAADGACTGITDLGEKGLTFVVPDIRRTSGILPIAVVDKAQYVLGVPAKSGKEDFALNCYQAFLDRLDACVDALAVAEPATSRRVAAICAFVRDRDAAHQAFAVRDVTFPFDDKGDCALAGARAAFRVDDVDPTESIAFRTWWSQLVSADLGSSVEGSCQVSGHRGPIARKMPGVNVNPGTPQALISANFAAAERYGASQSGGARVVVQTAIRSHAALNWLLSDEHHHRRVGELTFVWWLDGEVEFDALNVVLHPSEDDVAALLGSPWSGRPGLSPDAQFRLLVLSLTEARVVVRMDHTSALGEMEGRIRRWLGWIEQPGRAGRTWWPSVRSLAEAAVPPGQGAARRARLDRVVDGLARSALTGERLPRRVLAAAVDRCRARPPSKKNLTATELAHRYALLNVYRRLQEGSMPEHESTGSLCGRMLAQLESAQYAALGELNRNVIDRYYAAASVTPERVFPNLLADVHQHLRKAGRAGRKGAEVAIGRRLGELAIQLRERDGFPPTLTLEGQADFALGYWAERQRRFSGAVQDGDESRPANNDEESKQ